MRPLRSRRTCKPLAQGSILETFERGDKGSQGPGKVFLKEVKVSQRATPDGETPPKRLTALTAVKSRNVSSNTRGRKRQAELGLETPNKRHRDGSKRDAAAAATSKPIKVSEVGSNCAQRKRKASTEKDSSNKRRRVSETKERVSSSSSKEPETTLFHVNTCRDDFEAKYQKLDKIGAGGCGCVYAGIRIADSLPVAIKCVPEEQVDRDIQMKRIPIEVALMQRAASGPESIGKHAAVSLLDWYYIDKELIIVMERPLPAVSLNEYSKQHPDFDESMAKNFIAQMVDALIELHNKGVFHRDLKFQNLLVEEGPVPRIRIIDFGCGSFIDTECFYNYSGTISLAPSEWLMFNRYRAEPTTVWQLGGLLYRMLHGRLFSVFRFLKKDLKFSTNKSPDCLDFLRKCLAYESERATLEQLRLHPWLQ